VLASGTGPEASVWSAFDREGVFVAGTNDAMHQKTWTAANGWTTSWAGLGGNLTSSPTAATQKY